MTTLKDIADYAGISVTTASMALRGHSSIREETRQRVLEAKEKLGYKMKRRSTGNIAFVLLDRAFDNFYAEAFQHIGRQALKADLRPIYLDLQGADLLQGDLPSVLKDKMVDGAIVSGAVDKSLYRLLKETGVPLVVLGNYPLGGDPAATCEVDMQGGIHIIVERLVELGHRRIDLVTSPDPEQYYSRQLRSCFEAVVASSPELHGGVISLEHCVEEEEISQAFKKALTRKDRPTAFISVERKPVYLLYNECTRLGISIPREVSIAAIGKTPSSLRPKVAWVAADVETMSTAAFRKLQQLIETPEAPLTREIFAMRYVPGGAIGPAPGVKRPLS